MQKKVEKSIKATQSMCFHRVINLR